MVRRDRHADFVLGLTAGVGAVLDLRHELEAIEIREAANAARRLPLAIRHRPGRKTVVTPTTDGVAPVTTRADPALVKALARAFRYQRMLDEGRYASISEMAAAERIERGYLGTLLRLTLLAPDLVVAILDGRASCSIGLPAMLKPMPQVWRNQRSYLMPESSIPGAHCPLRAQFEQSGKLKPFPKAAVDRCGDMES